MRERMSGVDAAWLHMDRPANTADVVAIVTFEDRVPAAALRRLVEEKLLEHPRFRQRVVSEGRLGLATWDEDRDFSLGHHLVRRRLPGGGTRALERFASAVATEPLAPDRPLWRMYLVDGFGAGSALVAKLHHCIADGFALVALLLSLADEVAGGRRGASPAPAPPDAEPTGPPRGAHRVPAYRDLRLDAPLPRAIWRALSSPRSALELGARGAAFARSLARMTLLPADAPTRLSRPLSGRRKTAFSRPLPLPRLREQARALGVTVNDLLVAALAGALRHVLLADGPPPAELRALVPVNLRERLPGSGDTAFGNRFGLVFLRLPVGAADPAQRLARVRDAVLDLKRSPDAVVTYAVLGALGHLPSEVDRLVTGFFSGKGVARRDERPRPARAAAPRRPRDRPDHVQRAAPGDARPRGLHPELRGRGADRGAGRRRRAAGPRRAGPRVRARGRGARGRAAGSALAGASRDSAAAGSRDVL